MSKGKEEALQDGRRGKIVLDFKPHTCQRHSEASNKPVHTRTQRPYRNLELCLSVCCGGMGQQWTAAGAGALGVVDLGMT